MNLLQNSKKIWLLAGLILIGVADTSYLSVSNLLGSSVRCVGTSDCNKVLLSQYAELFGIPLAFLGLFYYLSLAVMFGLLMSREDPRILRIISVVSGVGVLFSLWLIYLQYAVIEAWCSFCLVSAGVTTLIFVLSFWEVRKMRT